MLAAAACLQYLTRFVTDFADQLCRLNASESTSSSSSVSQKLTRLQNLHDCVERVLLSPLNRQALAKECGEKWMNEILDGFLRLLDVCGIAKDALSKTMESTHELQLIMRRRRGADNSFRNEVRKYPTSRKEVKKAINKASKSTSAKKICESPAVIRMLKELDAATGAVFESLLSFVAGLNSRTNTSRWSLFTKLVQPKRVACEDELAYTYELENVDAALKSLISRNIKKSDNTIQVEKVQNCLRELETNIQEIEGGLECLFRGLTQSFPSQHIQPLGMKIMTTNFVEIKTY